MLYSALVSLVSQEYAFAQPRLMSSIGIFAAFGSTSALTIGDGFDLFVLRDCKSLDGCVQRSTTGGDKRDFDCL